MKTCNLLFALIHLIIFNVTSYAQNAGDIAFTGFNADGNTTDGFSFYVINEIPSNTTIYFTDNDWDGSSFPSNEGTVEWSHTAALDAGTTIVIDNYVAGAAAATIGTATETDAGMNISASNDAVYAYVGSLGSPTTFLGAIGNNTTAGSDYNLTGTGLIEGTTAISIAGDDDVLAMTQDLSAFCPGANCAQNIYDVINWSTDDGPGDQSSDGGSSADFPTSVADPDTGTPLPVELVSFEATVNHDKVKITWSTASEIDNDYFIIEKSVNGTSSFEVIGRVDGVGNTQSLTEYLFKDEFLSSNTNAYYRLKQVDFDGEFEYSPVVSVSSNKAYVKTEVFPNLFANVLNINTEIEGDISILVYDNTGEVVYRENQSKNAELIKLVFPPALKIGVYHLRLSGTNGTVLKKIVKAGNPESGF